MERGGITIGERFAAAGNRPSGFDYLRLTLATGVVAIHTFNAVYPMSHALALWQGPLRPMLAAVLPMFFALSGFLVAGSLERSRTMVSFLGLRAIRLAPALAVDTLLAALILGPLLTALPLDAYFADPLFRLYLRNILGDVHYLLPGVFATHPTVAVNLQLWTVPWELVCYVVLTLLALFGLARRRTALLILSVALAAVTAVALPAVYTLTERTAVPAPLLVECFLFGVVAWLYRDRIPLGRVPLIASAVLTGVLMRHPFGDLLAAIPVTYLTIALGLLNPPRTLPVASGDYSYGIFLYGFPIQQLVYALLGPHPWWLNFLLAYPAIVLLAVFSWHCVEAPARRLRPALFGLEAGLLRRGEWLAPARWLLRPPTRTYEKGRREASPGRP